MASIQLSAEQRSRARGRSFDGYESSSNADLDPKTGTKRLFSNRESVVSPTGKGVCESDDLENESIHTEKRHRAGDWPLPRTSPSSAEPSRQPLRKRHPNSPSSIRLRRSSSARPSKFVEGSMNDRVSKQPPTTYLGETELRERFDYDENEDGRGRRLTRGHKFPHHRNTSTTQTSAAERSEISRHSIFRFGRSLAASFNPNNWKIFSKGQQPSETEEDAQLRVLKERKEEAERMYKELKASGQFQGSSIDFFHFPAAENRMPTAIKHDSGVEFSENDRADKGTQETSKSEKRYGKVFLEPPKFSLRDQSPASDSGATSSASLSAQQQSFHFKKPSLPNIRKSFVNDTVSLAPDNITHQARRIPSRKDLQKQQKLVKKVSDLEDKLQTARRQLSDALTEPIPSGPPAKIGRAKFVPGALASLPSERLLSGYVDSEADATDNESLDRIGEAITSDNLERFAPVMSGARNIVGNRTPTSINQRLPRADTPPHDHALPSVEKDNMNQDTTTVGADIARETPQFETATEIREMTEQSYNKNHEEHESTEKTSPNPLAQSQPGKAATKKRKSAFERTADDSGSYRPGLESESDVESAFKKTTPRKKNTTTRPRKLQKTAQGPTDNSSSKIFSGNNQLSQQEDISGSPTRVLGENGSEAGNGMRSTYSVSPRRNSHKSFKKVLTSPPPSGRLTRPRQHARRQSISVPASEFADLDYKKPSRSPKATNRFGQLNSMDLANNDIAYSANPSTDTHIPPMPELPKAVRLPSGEIIPTTPAVSRASTSSAKLSKPRPQSKDRARRESKTSRSEMKTEVRKQPQPKSSFDWDEDVF